MRILGIDPGLRAMGWGVIESVDNRLVHIANGTIKTAADRAIPERLVELHDGLRAVMSDHQPEEAAVEITLANKNPDSTLKLGMARGIALSTPALVGLPVGEYLPMIVKKSVVGTGHAGKEQVQMMVSRLLPGCELHSPDSADALAVAICHAHNLSTGRAWSKGVEDPLMEALINKATGRRSRRR
ncbi:crossover junction endodeoxyribonuclease RuvC [Kiloniella sp. b19]|uniref:crossover junction endodeoxyribonuclease RuvC n=1 Tax=Kiloniella sp. GXU_MW_B19 TaxID=3141326 RepID=UPI0031D56169